MGFSEAVQWWQQEQLRALVLTSLIVQYFLLTVAILRKYRNWPVLKFFTWLAYLASDALAVYALATLFNRHRKKDWISSHQNDASLEALWAPILLWHLGGLDAITAYNIEDNELWSRHFLTAISQIIVAIYVVRKSWPRGDKFLQNTTILIFVPAALKCMEKPLALKRASINSIVSASGWGLLEIFCWLISKLESLEQNSGSMNTRKSQDGLDDTLPRRENKHVQSGLKKLLARWTDMLEAIKLSDNKSSEEDNNVGKDLRIRSSIREHGQSSGNANVARFSEPATEPISLDEYVRTALNLVKQTSGAAEEKEPSDVEEKEPSEGRAKEKRPSCFGGVPYRLFVDLAYTYTIRLSNIRSMMQKKREPHILVRCGLSRAFDRFYTKNQVCRNMMNGEEGFEGLGLFSWGFLLRAWTIYLTFAAIGCFHKSNRESYNATDVKITYALICCTASLEYISLGIFHMVKDMPLFLLLARQRMGTEQPSRQVCAKHPWPDQVAQYNLIGYLARNKKYLWLRRLLFVGKGYIDQLWCMKPSSSKSSSSITELVHKHIMDGWQKCITNTTTYRKFNDNRGQRTLEREECEGIILKQSLQRPFDESVLLWHLATDLCFPDNEDTAKSCRVMSNYMAYLLFVNPEMLMPGARRSLFKDAYGELKELATEKQSPEPEDIAREIIKKQKEGGKNSGLVHDAWVLFRELKQLAEEKGERKMWTMIEGVWVEMLCFSASRCRGYLHAKSLGNGGEYLSYVWLLLWYMGMETFAERQQRTEDPSAAGDVGATGPTPTPLVTTGDNSA